MDPGLPFGWGASVAGTSDLPGGGVHTSAEDSDFILDIEDLPKLGYNQYFNICSGLQ